jgi:hypothetical protein
VKKLLPFPIENLEEPLGDVYLELDNIRKRIEVSKRNNVVNLTPARLKKLSRMQYKINSAMFFIRSLTKELDTFWIN